MELRADNNLYAGYELLWYVIKSVIGKGGFGITYLAKDKNLDRMVAIKEFMPEDFATRKADNTVNPRTSDDEELYKWGLERFVIEAQTLAKFTHPNIVRVLSVFESNNTAYMVMEYAEGKDLSIIFKEQDKFTEEHLLNTFIPIIDGLSLVHSSNFIHRDIKPSNIYICKDHAPLLLDFGSARQSISGKTKAMTSLVTYGYAPYEQYNEGTGKQGPWTDIYSLGASIYFCITGKKPVDALSRGGGFLHDGFDTYQPVSILAKNDYSENFLLAIDHALMFKAEERPQDILNWANMLLGNTRAPKLPDYMLRQPEANDEKTVIRLRDANSQKNVSRNVTPGPQGLVDTHGRRNTGSQKINKDSIHNSASALRDTNGDIEKTRPTKRLIILIGLLTFIIAPLLAWQFISPQSTEDKIARTEEQKNLDLQTKLQIENEAKQSRTQNKIKQLLNDANQAFKLKNYVTPANNNAIYYYKEALALDTTNVTAKNGLLNIENELIKIANSEFMKNNLTEAKKYLNKIDAIGTKTNITSNLRSKIKKIRTERKEITNWLSKAEEQMKEESHTTPVNNNAYDSYKKVLQREPANQAALDGIKTIQQHYKHQFNKHIKASQLKAAENDLNSLRITNASSTLLTQLKNTLEKSNEIKISTPPPKKIVSKINIEQASNIMGKFKTSIEKQQLPEVKKISSFIPGREKFVSQLFDQHKNIKVNISNFQFIEKEQQATAQITLTNLIDNNGNTSIPESSWNKFKVVVKKDNDQIKVYW